MRISDWSSDVCSSDLPHRYAAPASPGAARGVDERIAPAAYGARDPAVAVPPRCFGAYDTGGRRGAGASASPDARGYGDAGAEPGRRLGVPEIGRAHV